MADNNISFIIALKQNNINLLSTLANSVSEPESLNYGKYLDINTINDIIAPSYDDKQHINSWLNNNKIGIIKDYGDALYVKGNIKDVSRAFKIIILPFRSSFQFVGEYLIPSELKNIVSFIEGLSNRQYKRIKVNPKVKSNDIDNGYVGRESLAGLYNINLNITVNNVSVGLVEYTGSNGFNQDGLINSELMNSENKNPIKNSSIIGDMDGEDVESQLDVTASSIVAPGVDLWYWKVDSWLYSFAVDFFNNKTVPDVISMSWGWAEDDQCSIEICTNETSKDYVNRVNNEYMKIALRGITITVASGDAGAPGRTSESCDDSRPINPVFPGSSPWVTSVGATVVLNDHKMGLTKFMTPLCQNNTCATGHNEASINYDLTGWTAGGGFGIYGTESTPKWQKDQVNKYLSTNKLPPKENFNMNGRGYPDVSVVGHNCPVYADGTNYSLSGVDGTSCSSPYFAGIVALMNDHQLKRKKPKVGFLNPLLYKMSKDNVFNDIVTGYNWCTEYECCINSQNNSAFGFVGSKGWDPVSGLGTPNVRKILAWLDKNT